MGGSLKSAAGCPVVTRGIRDPRSRQVFVPDLVRVREDLILSHLLLSEIVTFVHLPHKVEGFGFVRYDDVDCLHFSVAW
jgi:hypothetical protein